MMIQRTLSAALLLGIGGLALAMPDGPHRHQATDAPQAGAMAGCHEGMGMKDGGHRGHAMMGGMQRHGDGPMRHRHEQAPASPAAPADKAPPRQP